MASLLRRVSRAVSPATENGGVENGHEPPINSILDRENDRQSAVVQNCTSGFHPARWSLLYSCALIVEVSPPLCTVLNAFVNEGSLALSRSSTRRHKGGRIGQAGEQGEEEGFRPDDRARRGDQGGQRGF